MPPPKRPSRAKPSKGKKEAQTPQTANEYLAAADDEETTGSKWRPGDAAKAMRAYARAFEIYDQGLNHFPKDFDLAYNKANLQYLVVTDVRLREHAGLAALELLSAALQSHRYALSLDESNADVLYNTAQVLTSIADELGDTDEEHGAELTVQIVPLLQEAIELFESCAAKQEMQFEELQASANAQSDNMPDEAGASEHQPAERGDTEEWAVVTQPVTPVTLLETSTATLTAMTSLISAYLESPQTDQHKSAELAAVVSLATNLLDIRIPTNLARLERMPAPDAEIDSSYVLSLSVTSGKTSKQTSITPTEATKIEVILAIALFRSSIADAEYKLQLTSVSEYACRLTDAFQDIASKSSSPPSHLFAYAQSLAGFAAAIAAQTRSARTSTQPSEANTAAWQSLVSADDHLSRVLALLGSTPPPPDVSPPSRTGAYLLRGDVSLHRWRLASAPDAAEALRGAAGVLLKNAGVYYRGAAKLAQGEDDEESGLEAQVKAKVVARIGGEAGGARLDEEARDVLVDMVEEGLVEKHIAAGLV